MTPQLPTTPKHNKAQRTVWEKYVFLFAALEIVVIGAIAWFAVLQNEYFQLRNFSDTQKVSLIENLTQKQEQVANLQVLEEHVDSLNRERLSPAEYILPTGFDTTEMMIHIERFARDANIHIASMDIVRSDDDESSSSSPSQNTDVEGALPRFSDKRIQTATMTLNISLEESSYEDMKDFLQDLEEFTPLLNVYTMQYSNGESDFAMQLHTYYLEEK